MRYPSIFLAALAALSSACSDDALPSTAATANAKATAPTPVIDGHIDLLIHYLGEDGVSWQPATSYDIGTRARGQVDLARLEAGGVAGAIFTVGAPDAAHRRESLQGALDLLHALAQRHQRRLAVVGDAASMEAAMQAGRIAMLPGLEGGDQIDGSIAQLRAANAAGVRAMTLVWEKTNEIGDSNADVPRHGGLSAFGHEVVAEMNRLGMLVDLSHAAESTAFDAIAASRAPVILSHSSARALCDTPRNASDVLLRRVSANGGLVMVSFVPYLTSPRYRAWYLAGESKWARLKELHAGDESAAQRDMQAWETAQPAPVVHVADVADHVEHMRHIAGIDHVGLGSDFDGMYGSVEGLADPTGIPTLLAELRSRGWTEADLRKLAGGNFLRVLREVGHAPDRKVLPPEKRAAGQ